jgi:hypothetical protein
MQGTSIDLSIETSEKCAIGSEKKTEILTAENCFRKIMDNKNKHLRRFHTKKVHISILSIEKTKKNENN